MSIVVVATLTIKPQSLDLVREACIAVVPKVRNEPGCQLYTLHESEGTLVFIEQWADQEALATHTEAAAFVQLFAVIGDHLAAEPEIRQLAPLAAGDDPTGT